LKPQPLSYTVTAEDEQTISHYSVTVYRKGLSINEIEDKIELYPNPTSGEFKIENQ
jgi:hypothetical protein